MDTENESRTSQQPTAHDRHSEREKHMDPPRSASHPLIKEGRETRPPPSNPVGSEGRTPTLQFLWLELNLPVKAFERSPGAICAVIALALLVVGLVALLFLSKAPETALAALASVAGPSRT